MSDIHAIILTRDEERHLARCIASLGGLCASITVVDSGSQDATVTIAEQMGARVLHNGWVNYATQMNFAVDALAGAPGWLLRIDADEVIDGGSKQRLTDAVATAPADVDGLLAQRRIHFMGRRMRHGGIEPSWQLRLWRNGSGRCEQRWMDEHIRVAGKLGRSGIVISDINLNSLTWWTTKHNSYASREAIDALSSRYGLGLNETLPAGRGSLQARVRRFAKEKVYGRLPRSWRPSIYFIYRYLIRFGFLDGAAGWYFSALQAFWYRTLVEAKILEIEARAMRDKISIISAIALCTGIVIPTAPTENQKPTQR